MRTMVDRFTNELNAEPVPTVLGQDVDIEQVGHRGAIAEDATEPDGGLV